MRIARSKDGGWHVKEHVADHNHHLSDTFAEKQQWRSHRHIDLHTKQLIKHLRDNNVSMTKVFSIISSFFGTAGSAPFTKRSVRTLCAKLARDNADDDIGKTMEVFSKIKEDYYMDTKTAVLSLMMNAALRLLYGQMDGAGGIMLVSVMLSPLTPRIKPTCMTCRLVFSLESIIISRALFLVEF